jgi:hypothetical protein
MNTFAAYQNQLKNVARDENNRLLSSNKSKSNPYAYVYGDEGHYNGEFIVRLNMPVYLAEYRRTRYYEGFEVNSFSTAEDAADFVVSVTEMSVEQFTNFVVEGDGSPLRYSSQHEAQAAMRQKARLSNAKKATRVATDDRPANTVFGEITKLPAFKEALARFGQAAMIADRKVLTVNEYKLRYFAEAA